MPNLTRARVCAIGSENDMLRLLGALLDNCKWLDEDEVEDRSGRTLPQLIALVKHYAAQEGGDECGFYYPMVTEHPYGDALLESGRMEIEKHATGLWTACFTYESETAFQPEDWLRLHMQCRMLPMLALYANWDFGLEKGMKVFAGGRIMDDWNHMGETWFWLMTRYEAGFPPEEAVERLRKLRKTMDREEYDLTIGEMLASCMDNLEEIAEDTGDAEALRARMQQDIEANDYESVFITRCRIAESVLWETAHNTRWLACLEAILDAWHEAEGEDA